MTRYRQDAQYELVAIERKIAGNRKCADTVSSPKSAAILDATLPSLLARRDVLVAEIANLPDRPARVFAPAATPLNVSTTFDPDHPGWEIPEFLRRRK